MAARWFTRERKATLVAWVLAMAVINVTNWLRPMTLGGYFALCAVVGVLAGLGVGQYLYGRKDDAE